MTCIFAASTVETHSTVTAGTGDSRKVSKSIWAYPHLIKGIIAQFFYVGAQVGVGSFVIRFVKHTMPVSLEKAAAWLVTHKGSGDFLVCLATHIMPNTPEKLAAVFLVAHQVGFMSGAACRWRPATDRRSRPVGSAWR